MKNPILKFHQKSFISFSIFSMSSKLYIFFHFSIELVLIVHQIGFISRNISMNSYFFNVDILFVHVRDEDGGISFSIGGVCACVR